MADPSSCAKALQSSLKHLKTIDPLGYNARQFIDVTLRTLDMPQGREEVGLSTAAYGAEPQSRTKQSFDRTQAAA
ncbi:MAG: hypothetical protein NVS1B6_09130 [Steroidobacteraceae bacterium]